MWIPPLLLAVSAASPPADRWFFPGEGPEIATLDAAGTVSGVPARPTGEVLVGAADPAALAASPGVAQVRVLPGRGDVALVTPDPRAEPFALSRALRDQPGVTWAHPDLAVRLVPAEAPDDPLFVNQWHLDNTGQSGGVVGVDVRAVPAWGTTAGEGTLIAVIDSGVDTDHPDLSVINGYDYIDGDDDSDPGGDAHGTAVAGVAAAIGDNELGVAGVAWGADIYGVRLIGGDTTLSDVYNAMVESTDAGAAVINNSWGFGSDCVDIPLYGSMRNAFDYAEEEGRGGLGAVMVFAAGNEGCDHSNNNFVSYETVVGVSAVGHTDRLESYSSWGSLVDVAGLAGGIVTTDVGGEPGYGAHRGDADYTGGFSGTSSAAPVVSGVFALVLAANPQLTAAQARDVVCDTAVRMNPAEAEYDADGWSPYFGCGRIDAAAAVWAVANGLPGAPEPLGPVDAAFEHRVVLSWTPAEDPDGDPLVHEVRWWIGGGAAPDDAATVELSYGDTLDLTDQVEVGDTVAWTVTAVDAWGAGPTAEAPLFTVTADPNPPVDTGAPAVEAAPPAEEPGGCSLTGGVPGSAAALLTGLLAAARRQRGQAGRDSEATSAS